MSEVLNFVYEIMGASKLWTTAYRPQTNGQIENANRTIAQMIRFFGFRVTTSPRLDRRSAHRSPEVARQLSRRIC
jgi:hypothetical protein